MLDPDYLLETDRPDCLIRPRVSAMLADAVRRPLTIVCAGAGYGKTRAVFEFAQQTPIESSWLHLSERDNSGSRFWAKYVRAISGWNETFVQNCRDLGFPDTESKLNLHIAMRERYAPDRRRLLILDDIHLINHTSVLLFLERALRDVVKKVSVILICRELPDINLSDFQAKGFVPNITEDDLSFTESELTLYLIQQGLTVSNQVTRDILSDTNGWAFAVNLIARSLKKAPGYTGYVSVAMKQNVFKLMETETFSAASERLKQFLIRLSLIDHLSAELVEELAGGDKALLAELGRHNAYIRFDAYIGAYLVHHLFLDFLRGRTGILTQGEIFETYQTAGRWCSRNGFETDALNYFEKIGDYKSITALVAGLYVQMPRDIAVCAAEIFNRAPRDAAEKVYFFAVMHVRIVVRLCRFGEAIELMRRYEERFKLLPEDDPLRNRTLGSIYYSWGNVRALMGITDERYDFDIYYAKMDECFTKAPVETDQYADLPIGFWASLAGSSRRGAPQSYIEAADRAEKSISHCWGGSTTGINILCRGELLFYQGNIKDAELFIIEALKQARENRQFEIEHKALFYLLRIALWQGNSKKAVQALKEIDAELNEKSYSQRFFNRDAAYAWYFCALRQPETLSAWLKEKFSPYDHAYYIENIGNQIKARYHYLTRNYPPLLAYVSEMKRRESILYGRIEMLATEACAHYQMKDKPAAFNALREAYETALPNGILAPFIELGKDMRSLVTAAMRESDCAISSEWLETARRGSASFAKRQSMMISDYEKSRGQTRGAKLSPRESEILSDLYCGLSRSEIAANRSLSINTVNSTINGIFNKLGSHSVVETIRIAAEEKLVKRPCSYC